MYFKRVQYQKFTWLKNYRSYFKIHGINKHLLEKVVVLKSCLFNANHQVVLAHNNSSSRIAHDVKQALVDILTFLMACTWENVTFAPEGKERGGTLG